VISAKIGHALDPFILKIYTFFFKGSKLNPNIFTICGLLFGIVTSFLIAFNHLVAAAVFLFFTGFFDLMDGAIARSTNNVTIFGGFLDSVLDRYTDLFLMLGVFVYFLFSKDTFYMVVTFFATIGIAIIPYVKARAEASSVKCNTGVLERPERLVLLFIGLLFNVLPYIVLILAVLTHVTVIQRMLFVRKALISNQ
jgi:CDP-diacylglycerol--glycerol-3-phosphate 3-phosphatidyltransferase